MEYIGERRTTVVRSKMGRGELCADEGKRNVVHHKRGLEREVTNFSTLVHWGTLGMGLYSGGGYSGDGSTPSGDNSKERCTARWSGIEKGCGRWL